MRLTFETNNAMLDLAYEASVEVGRFVEGRICLMKQCNIPRCRSLTTLTTEALVEYASNERYPPLAGTFFVQLHNDTIPSDPAAVLSAPVRSLPGLPQKLPVLRPSWYTAPAYCEFL